MMNQEGMKRSSYFKGIALSVERRNNRSEQEWSGKSRCGGLGRGLEWAMRWP